MSHPIQGSLAEFDHYMTTKLGATVGKPISEGVIHRMSDGLSGAMAPLGIKKLFYRHHFLEAVNKVEPEVLRTLNEQVRPFYVRACFGNDETYRQRLQSKEALQKWLDLAPSNRMQILLTAGKLAEAAKSKGAATQERATEIRNRLIELDNALVSWAKSWSIDVPWILDKAISTLYAWEKKGIAGEAWDNNLVTYFEPLESYELKPPEASFLDTKKKAKERYDLYLREKESIQKAHGWVKVVPKTSLHFDWVARARVLKQKPGDIAELFKIDDEDSVRRAIERTSDEIDPEFRTSK